MDVVFVIGLSLEFAGALLLATAYLGGKLVGDTVAMSWLHRRAVTYWQARRDDAQ